MTRKDHVLLAEAFADSRPSLDDFTKTSPNGQNTTVDHISFTAAYKAWERVRRDIAFRLQVENPRFDGQRFKDRTEL